MTTDRRRTLSTGQWADLPFEDAGMDRLRGAPEAPRFLKDFDFAPPHRSFDAAFATGTHDGKEAP